MKFINMTYMEKLDGQLVEMLKNLPIDESRPAIDEIKKKIVQSYRNGQRDCPKCNPRPSQGEKSTAR